MQTFTPANLTSRTNSELSALSRSFLEALAASEPFTDEWRSAHASFQATVTERDRRLRHLPHSFSWGR